MKINEITERQVQTFETPPLEKMLGRISNKIRDALSPESGIEWEDVEFNKAAQLTSNFTELWDTKEIRGNFQKAVAEAGLTMGEAGKIMIKSGLDKSDLQKLAQAISASAKEKKLRRKTF
jgi:hypothetical protein